MDNSGASECKFTCTRNERSQDSIKIFFINGATSGASNCTLPLSKRQEISATNLVLRKVAEYHFA